MFDVSEWVFESVRWVPAYFIMMSEGSSEKGPQLPGPEGEATDNQVESAEQAEVLLTQQEIDFLKVTRGELVIKGV